MITKKKTVVLLVATAVGAAVGIILVILGVTKPWASCLPMEDSAMGCPATGVEISLMIGGTILAVVCAVVFFLIPPAGPKSTRRQR